MNLGILTLHTVFGSSIQMTNIPFDQYTSISDELRTGVSHIVERDSEPEENMDYYTLNLKQVVLVTWVPYESE